MGKYSFKSAHPNAQKLMKDDFYWSPIEESGPYGSDDGWEAIEGFSKWRRKNKNSSPVDYLRLLIISWGYPSFNWNELDPEKIKEFLYSSEYTEEQIQEQLQVTKEAGGPLSEIDNARLREFIARESSDLNLRILLGYDNAIIGTAFAQIALEGTIHRDIKYLASTAIKRQLLPFLINNYEDIHKDKRIAQLGKMQLVIENIS